MKNILHDCDYLFQINRVYVLNSVTKIFVIAVKGFEPANSCVRDQDATTMPARHT